MSRRMLLFLVLGAAACPGNPTQRLHVTIFGEGTVEAVRGVEDFVCSDSQTGQECLGLYPSKRYIELRAVPADGWVFLSWEGDCGSATDTWSNSPEFNTECTVTFVPEGGPSLDVTVVGEGRVTGGSIDCTAAGGVCTEVYASGGEVTLTPTPSAGWRFARWEPACDRTASDECILDVTAPRSVTAVFEEASVDPEPIEDVQTGNAHTVVRILSSERPRVIAFGDNYVGQLGLGDNADRLTPTAVPGTEDVVGIHTQSSDGVFVTRAGDARSAGELYAAGLNDVGQLGLGDMSDRNVFTAVGRSVQAVATGPTHTCVADADGTVACTGSNWTGELGDGTYDSRSTFERIALSGVTSIAAGSGYTCAVSAGEVWCWGNNSWSQLGVPEDELWRSNEPVQVPGITDAVQVVASSSTTCVLRDGGIVTCWGYNYDGQVGIGSSADEIPTPSDVTLPAPAVQVAAGRFSVFALLDDGSVWAWGMNLYGEFGDGTTDGSDLPTPSQATGASAIAAGTGHACAIIGEGVSCWGDNEFGQLGDGTTTARLTPTPMLLP